ncbi:hypothetical protein HanXRQr2_Chr05g0213581 [Helianthus annuus]|uniref:Uncharacterized protein n=1 Tax=Helianthus annuus TaxID=4232 RepID=A0A9K3IZJ4_HELAN|nr:hypothetical protein HanXRQr2_Chr05g0213581 [Helianthus annuus]KAJ0584495.1 hypothetical protein HanHA89_Chr05g0189291 [Helianthus annuus]KAJ0922661.1 hypothetical protein HanPSC8_Chr05g0206481 [Helianthus annuus]
MLYSSKFYSLSFDEGDYCLTRKTSLHVLILEILWDSLCLVVVWFLGRLAVSGFRSFVMVTISYFDGDAGVVCRMATTSSKRPVWFAKMMIWSSESLKHFVSILVMMLFHHLT